MLIAFREVMGHRQPGIADGTVDERLTGAGSERVRERTGRNDAWTWVARCSSGEVGVIC